MYLLSEERKKRYLEIYENAKFEEKWEDLFISASRLEALIKKQFSYNPPIMKLIGSSATGTMRKRHIDLDYAVAFLNKVSNEEFLDKIERLHLDIKKIKQNEKYGYLKISGKYENKSFVLVPMIYPNGKIETYEQEAFYHPDFINSLKKEDHVFNTILAKEFFSQLKVYKEIKSMGAELLILKYRNFDAIYIDVDWRENLSDPIKKHSINPFSTCPKTNKLYKNLRKLHSKTPIIFKISPFARVKDMSKLDPCIIEELYINGKFLSYNVYFDPKIKKSRWQAIHLYNKREI